MILGYLTNLLHDEMAVITSQIVEYNRDFISQFEIKVAILMG